MAAESPKETLILDSTHLFLKALNPATSRTPHPFPPLPSDVPPSKFIPKTRFLVDAFRHAGDYSVSYFLSHFHSDHYTGLAPNWSKGIIFCSEITRRLLIEVLNVPASFIVALPLKEPILIDGAEVTLIDANHCPGAVQFLFKIPTGDGAAVERYVHTGDFRFCDSMKSEQCLDQFVGCDAVFLDTTYCNPKYVFPPQDESIDYVVRTIERIRNEHGLDEKVLFLIATYVIGKEKILLEIAERCSCKVYVDSRKMSILKILGYENSGVFTENESESSVDVVGWNVLGETWPYFRPNFVKMKEIMVERGFNKVVGFVPTGWTYELKREKFAVKTKDAFEIHLVPYSEHSNYDELREFVKLLKPKRVVPTVGSDIEKLDSDHVLRVQKHFSGLVDEMANKRDFLMNFHKISTANGEISEGGNENEAVRPSSEEVAGNSSPNWNEEEILQELNDSLPSWVTRDQKLELISSYGGDIVQVVSNFYEQETGFHRSAFASIASTSGPQTDLTNASEPIVSSPSPVKTVTVKDYNLKSPMKLNKSPISGKQKKSKSKNIVDKPKKRHKIDMKKDVTGPKQARITNFFTKATASRGGESADGSSQCSKDETPLSGSFDEAVEQFTQITNGDESSRSYAANILEKTKGDINMALEIYYSNKSEATPNNTVDSLATQGLSSIKDKLSPQQDKIRSKDLKIGFANPFEDESVRSGKNSVALPLDKYNPVEHACWSCGQPAPYIHLARTFDLVDREKGRIKATSMLCNMFRSLLALSPEDVLSAVYLCTNKIAADHEKMELNIGMSLVESAMEEACGVKRSKIKDMYDKLGDLGDVAQECRQTQSLLRPPSPLLVKDVISELRKICVQTGTGSNARKRGIIVKLMRSCREMEIKFLVRTLVRNLRIGAMMKTVLPAFAQAVAINSISNWKNEDATAKMEKVQSLSAAVAEAYNVIPSLDLIIPTVMKEGIKFSASTLSMTPGIPIKPMLAKITNGVPSVVKLFQKRAFTCEFKYDGQRTQIHRSLDGSVRVFSRNGDETTSRFPDVVASIKEACKPSTLSFVLDAEVVAVDRKNGCKIMSFQELSSRKRGSRDSFVPMNNIKVDICIFVFDIMFANGKQLLSTPLRERRKYMKGLFNDVKKGYFEYTTEITIEAEDSDVNNEATLTKINSFLEDSLRSSCEGLMVKSLDVDAGYSSSKRSDTWLKVKRDYVEGLRDSLDLVPIGAWHGNGRKAGWYSPFLMACYDPDTEEYQCVCRVNSGFTDSFYIEMKEFFTEDRVLTKKPPYYKTTEVPDMWFSAEVVWEIRGADFTVSPDHQAAVGLVHPSKGISMRFPRFIRPRVDDRSPEECSSAADVADLFQAQSRKMDVNSGNN